MSGVRRKKLRISDSLNQRLSTYAKVASAAGVSVLAMAGASEAEIVYTETYQVTGASFPLFLDVNNDGIRDFIVRTSFYAGTSGLEVGLDAAGYHDANNRVAGQRYSAGSGYFLSAASALRAGAEIGPKGNFSASAPFMAVEHFGKNVGSQYSDLGPWAGKGKGVRNRYLGLKFVIDGEIHYGWARFTVTLGHQRQLGDVTGVLTGYAYETDPNKPIKAGKMRGSDDAVDQLNAPAAWQPTLGHLANGARAMRLWRQARGRRIEQQLNQAQ